MGYGKEGVERYISDETEIMIGAGNGSKITLTGQERHPRTDKRMRKAKIVSLTEYVLDDFTNVIIEAPLIWDGDTYEETVTVMIFIGTIWLLIATTIGFAENNIKMNIESKKKNDY